MVEVIVNQALFGYRDGHDLLASSIELDGETLRLLRSATDVNIDGLAGRYLSTVIPLPKLKAHAFIRSWSAIGDVRPGSVFAHAILVDAVTLGRLPSFRGVQKELVYPDSKDATYTRYRKKLTIAADKSPKRVPFDLSLQMASAIYGTDKTIQVAEDDLEASEAVLYGLLTQQWPKLRRDFAFRTRLRPTETSWRVDVEVVARGHSDGPPPASWGYKLASDLGNPDPSFRRFLSRYGAESKRGRPDMPLLVDLFDLVAVGDFDRAVSVLVADYPQPGDMRVLKREVFGRDETSSVDRELSVLNAVLEKLDSFDLAALNIGERLALACTRDPIAAQAILGRLDLPALPDVLVASLAESISRNATSELLASIARSNPELAVLVIGLRPILLGVPEVWLAADVNLMTDVYFSATSSEQRDVFVSLLLSRSVEPLAAICGRRPALWWDLLAEVARFPAREQANSSRVLGDVLAMIGTSAVTSPTATLSNTDLGILLQASTLKNGLWRRVEASRWIELTSLLGEMEWPSFLQDRASAVALVSGNSNFSADTRSKAWRVTFGDLHERLKHPDFDLESWDLLSTLLPSAPAWDRCLRLRRGVVAEVRRDRWPVPASEKLIKESRGYESEMRAEIDRINNPHRSWLEQILARMAGSE